MIVFYVLIVSKGQYNLRNDILKNSYL